MCGTKKSRFLVDGQRWNNTIFWNSCVLWKMTITDASSSWVGMKRSLTGSSMIFPPQENSSNWNKLGKSDLFLIFPFFVSVALMWFHNMPSFSRLCLFIVQPFSRKQECMCLILIFNVIHSVLLSHRINLFLTFSRKIKIIYKFKECKVAKLYNNSSANMHWQWRQVEST